jgi:hypothetical protein
MLFGKNETQESQKQLPIEKNTCDFKTYEIEQTYNKFQTCIYFD